MILEYSQLISSAIRLKLGKETLVWKTGTKMSRSSRKAYLMPSELKNLDSNKYLNQGLFKRDLESKEPYMLTHLNHPSTVWTRYSKETYSYMIELLEALCSEYTFRYSKKHKCETLIPTFKKYFLLLEFDNKGFVEPFPAMPDKYKTPNNSIKSYRDYYNGEKQDFLKYKNRSIPYWIKIKN